MNIDPEMLLQTVAAGNSRIRAYALQRVGNAKFFVKGMTSLHMPQQILEMPVMGMDTRVSRTSERDSALLELADFGANLDRRIPYALPYLPPCVTTVGSFHGAQKVRVYVIKVW
jgi:hypothetical protein